MPPHFKRAVIYGVGLLGGSLGMALRRRNLADQIVGLGRARKRLEKARQMGLLDEISAEPAEAMEGADALILCLPPRLIRKKWAEIAALARPGIFITDVGSVKAPLVAEAEERLPPGALFIGSHPMAGSEKSGFEAARGDLFEGSASFVTPTARTPAAALSLAAQLWRAVGSRLIVMNPERHDQLLARASHLPHLAASALVETLYQQGDATLLFRAIVGNGFRDTTRVASGPPDVWEQIFSENAAALGESLDDMIAILTRWRELLRRGDAQGEIEALLERARGHRAGLSPEGEPASASTAK